MNRATRLTCLITVLLLGLIACGSPSTTNPPTDPPETEEPPPVLSLRIDPETQTVTPIGGDSLGAQQQLKVGNDDFKLENFDFVFLAGNRVRINADFVNEPLFDPTGQTRDSKALLVPITFEQNKKTSEGITSLTLPQITADTLGGAASLLPNERVENVEFMVQHAGKAFDYAVDAFSKVEDLNDCSSNEQGRFTRADLEKLNGCEILDGELFIDGKGASVDLSALDDLRSVTGNVLLRNLNQEDDKELFPALQVVRGDVGILNFENRLRGFNALERITGTLSFGQGKGKLRMSGFKALTTLDVLSIGGNAFGSEAFDADFLAKLTSVGTLDIRGNMALEELAFLNKLATADMLIIENNDKLASITGLEQLEFVGQGKINNNQNLDCSLLVEADEPYLPKFLPIEQSTGNKVDCFTAPEGDIAVSTQEELDALGGITLINGSLEISFGRAGVRDISSLEALKEIRGGLSLLGEAPQSLKGLDNLESIGGDFEIAFVSGEASLAELKSLTTIGGTWRIIGGLSDFSTLPLQAPSESEAREDAVLEQIGGLEVNNCVDARPRQCSPSEVRINNLTGLAKMADLNFDSVTIIGSDIKTLEGLEDLKELDKLVIESNKSLENIIALEGLAQVGFSAINDNAKLDCSLAPRPAFLPANESEGNKTDCPTEPTIFGDVFVSKPEQLDGLKDVGVIKGSLTIKVRTDDGALSDLSALSSLREVDGDLTIGVSPDETVAAPVNGGLKTLKGLEALESVSGDLIIRRNRDLESLGDLAKLSKVLGFSDISENAKLDCSQSPPPFLPADFSIGNLNNCPTETDPFALETSSATLIVGRGQESSVEINIINRVQGFDEAIAFRLASNPHVTASFDPNPSQTKTVMRFSVASDAPVGEATLVIKGLSEDTGVEQAVTIPLFIEGSSPSIASVEVLNNGGSKQASQGAGLVTLVVEGQNLQSFENAQLEDGPGGSINLSGQLVTGSATASRLELRFVIPHGVRGEARLSLTTDAGTARFDGALSITAITVNAAIEGEGRGTPDSPFASIGEAFTVAEAGDTVFLENGRYTSANETFPLSIPAGVNVIGESQEGTIIEGLEVTDTVRESTVTFQGDGSLSNVTLKRGLHGVYIGIGTIELNDISITEAINALDVFGGASVVAINVNASNNIGYGAFVGGSSSLTLDTSSFSGNNFGVVVTDDASLAMTDVAISLSEFSGVYLDTAGDVTITRGSSNMNEEHGLDIDASTRGELVIKDMEIMNNKVNGVDFEGDALTLRAMIAGSGNIEFVDNRPARATADGPILELEGTKLGDETCGADIVVGGTLINTNLLTITNDNNRVRCSLPTSF